MTSKPRPYLEGPTPRRLTPWLWSLATIALVASLYKTDRELWLGPLLLLFGLMIGAQGVDALRTGRLLGGFPNKWPIDAARHTHPFAFWRGTVVYLVLGPLFIAAGVAMLAGWLTD